jgi:excisionase family DNA binding protein
MAVKDARRTLTVTEAARELGISKDTAYGACRAGTLPAIRIGRRVIISREVLDRVLAASGTR